MRSLRCVGVLTSLVDESATDESGTVANADWYVNTVYLLFGKIKANVELLYALSILKTEPYTVSEHSVDVSVVFGLKANPICADDNEMVLTPDADNTVLVGLGFPTEAADNRFELNV